MAGHITIIPPRENFLKVPKGVIFNDSVDTVTLGIYVKVISLGSRWDLNVRGLAKSLNVSEDRIRRSFAVLEKTGYLRRYKAHGERGRFSGWDYEVSSEPFTDIAKIPTAVKTDIGENRHRENDTQNRDNTENRDRKEENREERGTRTFTRPTVDEVRAYCESRGSKIDPEAFVDYYDANGWKVGRAPMKDWRAAVRNWERRDRESSPAKDETVTSSTSDFITKLKK